MIRRLGTRAAQNGSPVATGSTMKLPLGRHNITYKAKDANGNEAQATTVVIVQSGIVLCVKITGGGIGSLSPFAKPTKH
jgi:hypothetical protein